jgi:hypothetical protein
VNPTLPEFLLACIAEDEAAAGAATAGPWRWVDPRWGQHPIGRVKWALVGDRDQMILPSHSGDMWPSASDADHITRWDPARVLADCEGKQQIVRMHRGIHVCPYDSGGYTDFTDDDDEHPGYRLCPTLIALALLYADRSGWREEWRP